MRRYLPQSWLFSGMLTVVALAGTATVSDQPVLAQTAAPPPVPGLPTHPCHLLTSAQSVPDGFGAAYNVFSADKALLLAVGCGSSSNATFTVGNGQNTTYVYRFGYEWVNGAWKQITLDGSQLAGQDWYVGTAKADLFRSQTQLAEDNFVLAYTCLRQNSSWNCGCRDTSCMQNYWQLQAFRQTVPSGAGSADTGGSARADELKAKYPSLYNEELPWNNLFYGLPTTVGQFYPARVGDPGKELTMRFRAQRSGTVVKVSTNNRYNKEGQNGYSSGDTGRIHAELRTDDGSSEHLPTKTVLARTNAYVPRGSDGFVELTFQTPVRLEAGRLYHLVFVQESTEYASKNVGQVAGPIDPVMGMGPFYGFDALVYKSTKDNSSWTKASITCANCSGNSMSLGWLIYSDGKHVYIGSRWTTNIGWVKFGGNARVRQVFTVEGPTRRVTGVWFLPARPSGTSEPLVLHVKDASARVLAERSIASAQIAHRDYRDNRTMDAPALRWVYVEFPSVITFQSGSRYSVELSSNGGYTMKVMQDKFPDINRWSNAHAEYSADNGKTWGMGPDISVIAGVNSVDDVDFGFGFTLEGGPKYIKSIAGPESTLQ